MKSMGDLLKRAIGQSEKLPPKYWTEGWNKFSFLMTPEQVKEVFEAYHLIIINSSVPIDYVESELSEYLSAYSETYKQLCSGEKVTTCSLDLWRRHYIESGKMPDMVKYDCEMGNSIKGLHLTNLL